MKSRRIATCAASASRLCLAEIHGDEGPPVVAQGLCLEADEHSSDIDPARACHKASAATPERRRGRSTAAPHLSVVQCMRFVPPRDGMKQRDQPPQSQPVMGRLCFGHKFRFVSRAAPLAREDAAAFSRGRGMPTRAQAWQRRDRRWSAHALCPKNRPSGQDDGVRVLTAELRDGLRLAIRSRRRRFAHQRADRNIQRFSESPCRAHLRECNLPTLQPGNDRLCDAHPLGEFPLRKAGGVPSRPEVRCEHDLIRRWGLGGQASTGSGWPISGLAGVPSASEWRMPAWSAATCHGALHMQWRPRCRSPRRCR